MHLLIRPLCIATLSGCPTLATPLFLSLGWESTLQIFWAGSIATGAADRPLRPETAAPGRKPYNFTLSCIVSGSNSGYQRQNTMTEAGALEVLVTQQMILAMKAHDAERTGTLRLIKSTLKSIAIEKRDILTPAEEQKALASMVKQRRDSIELYTQGKRPELAAKEAAEIVVIEEFQPKAMDEASLQALVTEAAAEVAAATGQPLTPKQMGPVIKAVQAKLQAKSLRAEGRAISELVKKALAG